MHRLSSTTEKLNKKQTIFNLTLLLLENGFIFLLTISGASCVLDLHQYSYHYTSARAWYIESLVLVDHLSYIQLYMCNVLYANTVV